ncbi:superoxide dismutase family protein [Psychrobacter sp. AOP22-C1-22]|uniref:superoxide dismutase family protein n=1 Tax=unclassified Psychrobacter TaxID=196806 RepID=UPI001787B5C7|nr:MULTISPECIES: superoxide dismutase family protein [unclassified Psychrobacter]MBE0407408.1 superoxide dismutase family protein [Psychrobacter sp. FME6]MBE0443762.1 superoxide dismutase family protein [Psychrobacter sp. FME5]MDN5801909.1 superoxide dismutase family protein [Psychrobacter sp.]
MNKTMLASALLCGSALAMTGCQTVEGQMQTGNPLNQPTLKSTINAVDGKKSEVGQVFLRPVDGGVQVYGKLMNLQPGKTVSLHIHETGSCDAMGKAAGGHFNPDNNPHSNPDDMDGHAGDLPNLTANDDGVATINYVNKKISAAEGGKYSVNRLAFIVHGGVDDYTSQPAGDSGDRVACGIIKKS